MYLKKGRVACWAYRDDDWGGGFYKAGVYLWRFEVNLRWVIWRPITRSR
jgi:hypothetical protein